MVREWYRKKGFRKNPLHEEPHFKDVFLGYDVLLEELFYRINAGSLIFVEGEIGKTALLLKIIEKYRGKGKVAYINCENVKNEPDIKVVLANGKKRLSRYIKGFPKKMILLLDNVSSLSYENSEKIKHYFDNGNILSVVMTGKNYSETDIPESLKHRIGNRIYKLRALTKHECADIVMERLNFPEFIKEEIILMIAQKTKNIKDLMKECHSALLLMANQNEKEVTKSTIHKLFQENERK